MKKLISLLSVLSLLVLFVSNSNAQKVNPKVLSVSGAQKTDSSAHPNFTKRVLEFRGKLFTDLEGIKSDQPNGLIQTNFYFSYKRRYDSVKYSPVVLFRNLVLADFTFSKIEENNRELPVRYADQVSGSGYLNRLDLYQYANIKVTTKMNLATLELFDGNGNESFRAYLDLLGAFYRTALHDSLKISDTKNVISIAPGINFRVRFYHDQISKLSAELSYTYIRPSLFNNNYKEITGPQYLNHKGQLSLVEINEKNSGINIIDLIIGHEGNNSNQFLRVSLLGNYLLKNANSTPNIFYQLQMGVDYKLENIFSDKKGKN